ncbi:MAG TPA: 4a-hydroxytetrahydrobiopterin dehydratase [Pyrinomonadaceae bacterium]|nr:4a-hydroxytetrahydrobiopterin dehydratase [Pyrinomonadaceae bacterium]
MSEDSETCDLANRKCVPCHGGVPPLSADEIGQYLGELQGWEVVDGHHLKKTYAFPNFEQSLALANRIGEVAEAEGHHPDICFGWGHAEVTIYTHAIDGLSESDFILAAKIDEIETMK